jgi:flavin-dependent dehydrogenase
MDTCDVVIVGGGPAGSACAWGLRHAGLDVVIVDKAMFPRDKVCAGWITPQVLDDLEIDRTDYREGRAFQRITGFRVGVIGEGCQRPASQRSLARWSASWPRMGSTSPCSSRTRSDRC